jgi:hypothetical protein
METGRRLNGCFCGKGFGAVETRRSDRINRRERKRYSHDALPFQDSADFFRDTKNVGFWKTNLGKAPNIRKLGAALFY